MHPIEQRIHDENLRTAWALASEWPAEHQDRLTDLIVDRFLRQPEPVCSEVPA